MVSLMDVLDLLGTGVFAISGALAAGRKRMDAFGVVVLGCVTALGGGTLRDLVLGIRPVFWIANAHYLGIAVVAALGTYLLARRVRLPSAALVYMDAVGLAVFTIVGFEIGHRATGEPVLGIVMGVTTAVVGGILRDVLTAEVPLILRREIYASASLCGAVALALLYRLRAPAAAAATASFLVTLAVRLAAVRWNLALPVFRLRDGTPGAGPHPDEKGATRAP